MTAPPAASLPGALRTELQRIAGAAHVIEDPALRGAFEVDATGRFGGRAAAVVRPGDAEEVAQVLRACSDAGVAIVPQGGNTGLVGGAVPRGGEVLLSLARLDDLQPVDPVSGHVVAGAGVTLAAVHERLEGTPLTFGLDFPARDTATVGGALATNAGGPYVVRYGPMAAQVAGVQAVLADGTIVDRLHRVAKDTAGYALDALLAGSEGTLAVITAVRLQLVPRPPQRVVAIVGLSDMAAAVELVTRLRRELDCLHAADFFHQNGLDLVCSHRRLRPPLEQRFGTYVLLECAGDGDLIDALANTLVDHAEDAVVADDGGRRAELWTFREAHNEAIRAQGLAHKLDVALPLARIAAFENEVEARVLRLAPEARIVIYGHLADGNLHVNVLGLDPDDERVDACVLEAVADAGGSISAEHGVGQAKAAWLHLTRSSAELTVMRAIKSALDPGALLNPGKVLVG